MSRMPACVPSGAGETTNSGRGGGASSRRRPPAGPSPIRAVSAISSSVPAVGDRIVPPVGYPFRRMSPAPKDPSRPGLVPLVAIFLAAFLVRAAVSHELSPLGLWAMPQLDARENLVWARSLAAGDFRWPTPPNHGPVYPYLLAGLLKATGGSLAAARLAQAALAGGTAVLLALAGTRLFGRRAGIAAGVLLALSGPVAFVDVALSEEVLLLFLATAALAVLARSPSLGAAALAGVFLGLASGSRPTMLLFALASAGQSRSTARGRAGSPPPVSCFSPRRRLSPRSSSPLHARPAAFSSSAPTGRSTSSSGTTPRAAASRARGRTAHGFVSSRRKERHSSWNSST